MLNEKVTPFVKWVGGKRQLLDVLSVIVPQKINRYFEPFLGGGALLLDILPENAIVSDINYELITTWKTIKGHRKELMNLLNNYVDMHNKHGKDFFYDIREKDPKNLSELQIAARFIYLNKTCFNGLYRVNRENKFNTPFNNKDQIKSSTVFNANNLNKISEYLNNNFVDIRNEDFEQVINMAEKDDFIFVDPPYDFDDDKGFDSYTANSFGKEGQKRC